MITEVIKGHKNVNLGSRPLFTDSKTVGLTMAFIQCVKNHEGVRTL